MLTLNAFNPDDSEGLDPEALSLVERRQKTFGPTSMLFYRRPLNIVRGEGVWLYDADGRRYLDAYNNVPSIGHCHPHVVAAVARQMGTLNTHTRYLYENVYDYAERLLATFPPEVSNIVFTCTGSESVDLALRIARTTTGGKGFIATANAYHGNTTTATEVSPSSASAEPVGPHIVFVAAPDTYRAPDGAAEDRFLKDVETAIETLEARGFKVAGMIADSILSSDGVYPGLPGFLANAAALVRKAGGLYIADEVQPGFGRTGAGMWGFARHDLVPDLVVMGKPMGNGYPIGAVVAKPEVLAAFGKVSGYFNTFGGSPVAAAAGMAVLDIIEQEGLIENARQTGDYLMSELRKLQARHATIGDVRGAGLFIGIEFVVPDGSKRHDRALAVRTMNGLRERAVLGGTAGIEGNVWKVRPPLLFTREHADLLVATLDAELTAQGSRLA
ncbi:MAG: aspartate aminotransferase family protein [Hyphomicrobium sp.]|nr:aspartate aminotransferase family protein [Hyphomicrobium sp.]